MIFMGELLMHICWKRESQTSTKRRTCAATVFNCHVRHVCCNKNLFIVVQNYRRGGNMFCALWLQWRLVDTQQQQCGVKSIFSKPWACCYLRKFEVKIMADDPMAVNRCWLQILEFSTSDEFPLSLPPRILQSTRAKVDAWTQCIH